jgi:LysM repeat protein
MVDTSAPRPVTLPAPAATTAICPYLLSADGAWRASTPAREHRCTAVQPSTPLASDKQRRLCLTDGFPACATYQAAAVHGDPTLPAESIARERTTRSSGRTVVRTVPVVLDHGKLSVALPTLRLERGFGQGALVILMAVAFAAIIVARLSAGGDSGGGGQVAGVVATPAPAATHQATARPSPTTPPSARPQRLPSPTPKATPKPEASTAPAAKPTTYKVKRGDTLSGIAARFGTTVAALRELNDIKDVHALRVGQVLKLP